MKELITIQNELKAPKNQINKFGNYKYRSTEDILENVKPLLTTNKCYLTISDKIIIVGDRYYIEATATLTNSEGNSISVTGYAREEENKKGMDSMQLTGATSSYARKYALNGLFAIDDTKDSDGLNKHGSDNSVMTKNEFTQLYIKKGKPEWVGKELKGGYDKASDKKKKEIIAKLEKI